MTTPSPFGCCELSPLLFLMFMAIRRKTIIVRTVIAAGAIVTVALLLSVFANLDRYRPEIISYLEEKTGLPVEIGRLTLTLSPSLSIRVDDFGLKSPPIFPVGYVIKAPHIYAKIDAGALLHRQIVVKSLTLEDPIINLISDPDGLWNFENPIPSKNAAAASPLGIISKVEIQDGRLLVSNLIDPSDSPGPVFFEAHNVSSIVQHVDLGAFLDSTSTTVAALGSLKADSLRFGAIQATNVQSKLRLLGKQLFFTGAEWNVYGGHATGNLSLKLVGENATFVANAQMSGVDMAHLLAAFPYGRGKMTGKMEGNLKLAGEIEHTQDPLAGIHGAGRVTVRNGKVPSLMLNKNLMKLAHFNDLGPAKQDPSSFSSISTDLELANLRISSRHVDLDGYGVDVDGSGSVSVSGSGNLNYQGVAEITSKQGFFTNLLARLSGASLKNGKLSFPFKVSGTLENPMFSEQKNTY
ncbi:MAG TPA: AsmA-like C-terminal region-containing protein [Terriglobia bacterium]|nr:AsmA-like C-terminal region-containing protein [Terriglobia bacterium]